MAAQDQRGDAQALWRPAVEEAKYSNAAMGPCTGLAGPGAESASDPSARPGSRGLTTLGRELLEDRLPIRPFGRT
jgi:hypothetical protein